ncbi:MAG: hypothetical protein BalsKO_25490 [Balneolaceae bacterium]
MSDFTYIDSLKNAGVDMEPDMFYFNFPGQGGGFILGFSGDEPMTIPKTDLKIEPQIVSNSINGFEITDPSGNKYHFLEVEKSLRLPGTAATQPEYPSAWYLTKIESANSDAEITLSYYDNYGVIHEYLDINEQTENDETLTGLIYQKHDRINLKSIESRTHKVEFKRMDRSDADVPSTWTSNQGQDQTQGLDSVFVKAKIDGSEKVLMYYDLVHSYPGNGERLFLDEVKKFSSEGNETPYYSFEYYNSGSLPSRTSLSIDHWGYYNAKPNSGLIPTQLYDLTFRDTTANPSSRNLFKGADRNVNENVIHYGSIKEIVQPTGGKHVIEYEPNDYSSVFFNPVAPLKDFVVNTKLSSGDPTVIDGLTFSVPTTVEDVIIDLYVFHSLEGTYRDFDRFTLTNTTTSESYYFDFTAPNFNSTDSKYFENWYFSGGGNFVVDIDFGDKYDDNTERDDVLTLFNLDVYEWDEVNIKQGGGIRVKKITIDDNDTSTEDIVKNYNYHYASGGETYSYGQIYLEPDYRVFDLNTAGNVFLGLTSNNGFDFGNANQGLAGYEKVKEYQTGNGYSIHRFSGNSINLNDKMLDFNTSILYSTTRNFNTPINHYLGFKESTSIYDEQEEIVSKDSSRNYLVELTQSAGSRYTAVKVKSNAQNNSYNYQPYYLDNPIIVPSESIQTIYEGANTMITRSDTEYDTSTTLPVKETSTNSNGDIRITDFVYAYEEFSAMETANMLTQPYSVTVKDNSGNVLSKNWTVWSNQISGNSNWNMQSQWEWIGDGTTTDVSAPADTTGSEVLKTTEVTEYDRFGNPLEVVDAKGTKTAYDWSSNGSVPIGMFKKAASNEVLAHSFAYDGLTDWTFVDRRSDSDTEATIEDGKLKLKNFASASNGEFDRVYYDHGSEITGRAVWEFDVQIANSNNWDLQMNAGGSSWNTQSGSSERAIWTAINNEQWRVYNGATWITLKSGLEVGKTYAFKIVMDSPNNRADYYLNGEQVGTNISYRNNSSGIRKLAFGNYGYGSVTTEWFIDNVRFYQEGAQATSQEVDPVFTTPLAIKDVSGSTSRFTYDEFGRLDEQFNPNGERMSRNVYFYSLDDYSSFNNDDPNRIETITYNDPADTTDKTISVTYLDGLGRTIQNQTRAKDGTAIITGMLYDELGRPHISSRPIALDVDSYTNGFVNDLWGTGFDGDPGEELPTNSEIYQYYDSGFSGVTDAKFAYMQTGFENSPLSRSIASGNAASALRLGQNDANMEYGLNSGTEDFSGFTDYELNKTVATDPNGNHTFSFTDGWGNTIASMVDMNGDSAKSSTDLIAQFQYDLRNQLQKVTDPRGLETDYTYNQRGQLIEKDMPDKDDPDNYRYDDRGNLRFVESAKHKNNGSSGNVFIGDLNIDQTITVTGDGMLDFDFDFNFSSSADEVDFDFEYEDGSDIFSYPFTAWEDALSKVQPVGKGSYKLNQTLIYAQNQYSLDLIVDFKPYKFTYNNYDELNRIVETGEYYGTTGFTSIDTENDITSSNIAMQKFHYGEANAKTGANNTKGRLAKVEYRDLHGDNLWGTTWYSYNTQGLVEWIIQDLPGGVMGEKKIEYVYDELGRMMEMKFQEGTASEDYYFRYSYDDLGRLAKTESRDTPTGSWVENAEYTYFADGQLSDLELGNNVENIDYQYGSEGWLDAINDPGSLGSDRFGQSLSYNHNGTISSTTWNQSMNSGSKTYNFSYDDANRLTNADQTVGNNWDISYGYDKSGNITTIDRYNNTGSKSDGDYDIYIPGGTNRINLLFLNGDDDDVNYDANGNMTENPIRGLLSARYDHRNLPYTISGTSSTVYHTYDADGQRVSKKEGSTTISYIRGADGQTIATYEDGSIDKWNILSGGDIVGTRAASSSFTEYFIKDHLGSTRAIENNINNPIAYFDYYPFGKLMTGRYTSTNDDRYKFTGHERDEEAGMSLDYMMARNYDPEIGRFLQIDPLAAEFPSYSPYNYALNNPIMMIDPDGRAATNCCLVNTISHIFRPMVNAYHYVNATRTGNQESKRMIVNQLKAVQTVNNGVQTAASTMLAPYATLAGASTEVILSTSDANVSGATARSVVADQTISGIEDFTQGLPGGAVKDFLIAGAVEVGAGQIDRAISNEMTDPSDVVGDFIGGGIGSLSSNDGVNRGVTMAVKSEVKKLAGGIASSGSNATLQNAWGRIKKLFNRNNSEELNITTEIK